MEAALPVSKREQSKEEKRRKILSAARKVFIEKGYHSASISDIIRNTDLARGTFYLYFKDKQEIFDTLITELFSAITKQVNTLELNDWGNEQEFYDRIEETTRMLFLTLSRHKKTARIVLTTPFGADSDFDRKIEAYHEMLFQVTSVVFQKAVDKNIISGDPVLLSHLVLGGIKEIIFQWIVKNRYQGVLEKEVKEIVHVFLKGCEV